MTICTTDPAPLDSCMRDLLNNFTLEDNSGNGSTDCLTKDEH